MIVSSVLLTVLQFILIHSIMKWYGMPEEQAAEVASLLAGATLIEIVRDEFMRRRPSIRRVPQKTREVAHKMKKQKEGVINLQVGQSCSHRRK